MPTIEPEIWKSARLTIERDKSETHGTVFRFSGPLTRRDMYNSLSPDAFRNIFESVRARGGPTPCTDIRPWSGSPIEFDRARHVGHGHYARCPAQKGFN